MKKILSILLVVLVIPLIVSCSSDDDASYYVKYEVKSGKLNSSVRIHSIWDITYKDVAKEVTVSNSRYWEGTYGPFKRGDEVYLKASKIQGTYYTLARISVSKDNEAFTIKAESENSGGASLKYVIDF